jgi:hypothetical protein
VCQAGPREGCVAVAAGKHDGQHDDADDHCDEGDESSHII